MENLITVNNIIIPVGGAIIWFAFGRYFKNLDKRMDKQDEKLDLIIETQARHGRKLLIHDIALRKLEPNIVNYDVD
jgi:hypothetical protein